MLITIAEQLGNINVYLLIFRHQLKNLLSKADLEKEWDIHGKFRRTNNIQYDYYMMCIKNHKRAIKFDMIQIFKIINLISTLMFIKYS